MTNRELARQFRQRCIDAGVSECALRWISYIDADDLARLEMAICEADYVPAISQVLRTRHLHMDDDVVVTRIEDA